MTNWKTEIVNPADTTTAKFGGKTTNYILQFFKDIDLSQAGADPLGIAEIATHTFFRSDAFHFWDSNKSHKISIVIPDYTSDKTLSYPSEANLLDTDEFTFNSATQTFLNKSIDFSLNTATNIPKSALPSTVMYEDEENAFGQHYQDIEEISTPANPASGTRRIFLDQSTGELSVRTPGGTTVSLEAGAAGGEANTASNVGAMGVGPFKTKTGSDLEFKNIAAGASGIVTVTDDTGNDEIDIEVLPGNIDLADIGGAITNRSALPTEIVYSDQTTTLGDFEYRFRSGKLILRDSDNSHSYIITGGDISADRILNIPVLTGTDSLVTENAPGTLVDKQVDVNDNYIQLQEISAPATPASTFGRLFLDSGTGEVSVKKAGGGVVSLEEAASGSGETNTMQNVGTAGVGVYKEKIGVDFRLKKINAGSSKVTITDDTGNDEIDVDVAEANLTLTSIGGTLSVAKGGTGATTLSGLLEGNGTSAITAISTGSNGEILTVVSGSPAWASLPSTIVETDQANTYGDFDQIFKSTRIKIRDADDTHQYSIVGGNITADRNLTLPALGANDIAVAEAFAQTLTNKTINASSNTITNIGDSAIAAHTTTKITTTNKSLLNSNIMYEDEDNNIGGHYLNITEVAAPSQPSTNNARLYLDSTSGALTVKKDDNSTVNLEESNPQSHFVWASGLGGSSANWSDGRGNPLIGMRFNGKNPNTYIVSEDDIVITRVDFTTAFNSKNGVTVAKILDDDVAVPNTTLQVNASTNTRVSTGSISQSITAGSEISILTDTSASSSGSVNYTVEIYGYISV